MAKVFGFNEEGYRRVREATRRTLGQPRVGSQRTARQPVLSGGGHDPLVQSAGLPWTIREYDAATGDVVQIFDRGRGRFSGGAVGNAPFDANIMLSDDEQYLYAFGGGNPHPNPNEKVVLYKWDINSGERVWYSDHGAFTAPSGTLAVTGAAERVDNCILEASDGFIWVCAGPGASNNGYVARIDPDTGNQTHSFNAANTGYQLLPCPTDGSVVVANSTASGGKYIRILDDTAAETHSYSTAFTQIEEYNGRLYVLSTTSIVILDASDLSTIDSRAGTGSTDVYRCLTTDGTTVWVATTGTGSMYRAYDATNLATENWNAVRDAGVNTVRLIYDGSSLWDFADFIRRIDPADGSEDDQSASVTQVNRRMSCNVSASLVLCCSSELIHALNKSDLEYGWRDTADDPQAIAVSSDDRIFVSMQRTGPT